MPTRPAPPESPLNDHVATQPIAADDTAPHFAFDNSYARELEGAYVRWSPSPVPAPRLVRLNRELAGELGLDADALASPAGVAVLAGNALPDGALPIAQAYAGHQFGGFSPQLGDGRALLLGELIDRHGRRRDIAFKGSGRTPFSRGGDGKAALGPVLREYLIGEAMHALGIPTTRALAAVATGEPVQRDRPLPGAVLTRVAASHLRVGTFEFFAVRGQVDLLRRLADHAIARHDPQLAGRDDRYLALLRQVTARQAALIGQWMGVGFIHGVMNTDNTTISGETIDYGPCAFIEAYDPRTVFSSIDHQGRYAFGNQPAIAQWNLARLAEALLPLIDADSERAVQAATEVVDEFPALYHARSLEVQRAKLGLADTAADADDRALVDDWLHLLHTHRVDHTLGFRRLAEAAAGDDDALRALFGDAREAPAGWLARWRLRLGSGGDLATRIARANPIYIPRNHQVEAALAAAVEQGDVDPFDRLLAALSRPFDERAEFADYALPAPPELTAGYRTFCGT
jgi:serine/tyrosine/threonine adenylyltransferase